MGQRTPHCSQGEAAVYAVTCVRDTLEHIGGCFGAERLSFRLQPGDGPNCRNHCVSQATETSPPAEGLLFGPGLWQRVARGSWAPIIFFRRCRFAACKGGQNVAWFADGTSDGMEDAAGTCGRAAGTRGGRPGRAQGSGGFSVSQDRLSGDLTAGGAWERVDNLLTVCWSARLWSIPESSCNVALGQFHTKSEASANRALPT